MTVDLSSCDREPIHIPGTIQAHGALIATDAALGIILRHSANLHSVLGVDERDFVGQPLNEVLTDNAVHDLRNALSRSATPARPGLLPRLATTASGKIFDAAVHLHNGTGVIEIEPVKEGGGTSPVDLARNGVARIEGLETIEQLIETAPRVLRALIGYDRVMIYRFAADGSGKVVAEVKRSGLESFLGQHFPASDIPEQARRLYLQNTIRVIGDVASARVPIIPEFDLSGEPLDLSFAHLRSVSPIHVEYLCNMGVSASMSISIVVNGELWGLIACHHYSARILSMAQRIAAELFGSVFSLKLEALQQKTFARASARAQIVMDALLQHSSSHDDLTDLMRERLKDLMALLPCDGIGLFLNGIWKSHGYAPPKNFIATLSKFVGATESDGTWATHKLSSSLPQAADFASDAAGVLAIPLSMQARDYLFFFRREQVQTVEWAGNPDKVYSVGPHGDRLTPRKSFAIWKELVEGQSLPWTPHDREIAAAAHMHLLKVVMRHGEIIAAERRRAEIRQKVLHEELNHRVKNILSLIKSLVSQPQSDGSLERYVSSLKGRIIALSHAHDQIVRHDGGGLFRDLLEAELLPYRDGGCEIVLVGPEIGFDARALSVLALVIHEMATNAAKYGALSRLGGQLRVHWSLDADGDCAILWEESGGPLVREPKRRGFGSVLLERSIPFDLRGTSEFDYEPSGFRARLNIPRSHLSVIEHVRLAAGAAPPIALADGAARPLAGKRVLLVEDQLLIALDAEQLLGDGGAGVVETAATPGEALEALRRRKPDVAILDINLGSTTSMAVADELAAQNVPFVFATGYGDSMALPPSHKSVTVVRKPYTYDSLIGSIVALIASAPAATDGAIE